ncbi:ATP-binding protein [Undibacterium sp. RTI2.1]|uniref:ATP-binding protein n=1 Tax=unclassified Undibacterium TaxID=2630295 RepID=UPI002AB40CBC|nr:MULTISPECIES: ATP-binding protein [unclassified Undibacterium]MDY7537884.1 ATP-binding protein [Undibacterium sp. 5I1]MEB0033054.1 ATP-binding protein [Undibacterium sp. RTI2.1]MEB0118589.1 ATP-binding protein [Undibacterium sp. RTI2.2]MEB0230354.1 ATP-binding protein [Undibacterium sp. 10I3]MEB0259745.1 ATP-binding protein [Undibacterium sp. 5I1]
MIKVRTIRQQLLLGLMLGMILTNVSVYIGTYLKLRHETNELFDYQLKQIVRSFPANMTLQESEIADTHPGKKIVVQVWNKKERLVFTSNSAINLPKYGVNGFFEVTENKKHWRIYSEKNNYQVVQAGQLISDREKIEYSLALRSLIPVLISIPLLGLLIWFVVGHSLKPLNKLATALGERSADALHQLDPSGYSSEIVPIVLATNALLARVDHSINLQKMFVTDAAHELRTPLAALKLQLQLVEKTQHEEDRKAGILKLHVRLNRATHLVQQLLTLARHSNFDSEIKFEKISLHQIAKQVVADFSLLAEYKNIDLGVDAPNGEISIFAHEESIRIMLGNLIDNAIRYTGRSGKIDVISGLENKLPYLAVIDNGVGISLAARERIFDRFYRCEGSGESGSGLGLTIVKNIVEQFKAKISVCDGINGQGTVFKIIFNNEISIET